MLPRVSREHPFSWLAARLERTTQLHQVSPHLGSHWSPTFPGEPDDKSSLKFPFPVSCIMGMEPDVASRYVFLSEGPFIMIFDLGCGGGTWLSIRID